MKTLCSLLASATLAALIVAATPTVASAWVCVARSVTGSYGWGRSPYLRRARAIALNQCAIRTRRGYYCRITSCR
jgi:hypothetical protein